MEMLLSPELGSAGDRDVFWVRGGDPLPGKHWFSWKKRGERAEKLLPVKFAA